MVLAEALGMTKTAPIARRGPGRYLHAGPVARAVAEQLDVFADLLEGLAMGWRDERWHELVDALRDAARFVRDHTKRPRQPARFARTGSPTELLAAGLALVRSHPATVAASLPGLGEPTGRNPFARARKGALRARRRAAKPR